MNLFDILSYRRGHLTFVVWDSVKLVCWSGRICKTVNGCEGGYDSATNVFSGCLSSNFCFLGWEMITNAGFSIK